jgi:hypothetical protein
LFRLPDEAEVVGFLNRHDVVDFGDKFNDGEIVALGLFVDVSAGGEGLNFSFAEMVIRNRTTAALSSRNFGDVVS